MDLRTKVLTSVKACCKKDTMIQVEKQTAGYFFFGYYYSFRQVCSPLSAERSAS